MPLVLGIDTSCYTTSLAMVEGEKPARLLGERRRVLQVPLGKRGLQQSAALFQHVQNLPELMEALVEEFPTSDVSCISASTRPRPVEGSYMPVFTAGAALGRSLAVTMGVPFQATSHQEGHLWAGLWSANARPGNRFLAVHLSGGTSEVLVVERRENGFQSSIAGGTTDLHAGQMVDRVGVLLGLPFPAGPHLEQLATQYKGPPATIPSSVQGTYFSFSGPESQARRLLEQGVPAGAVARGVERCLVKTLAKALRRMSQETGLADVLVVGGVAANAYLREHLPESLKGRARLYFAEARFSSDNAVGVALAGLAALG